MQLIQFEGRTVAVMAPEDLEALEAREGMQWKTLRECADILCLPDESPSVLPDKIRVLQACSGSEKQAKIERGELAEKWRTVAGELARELRDMREHMIDRGHSDETSDGIQSADNALASFDALKT